MWKYPNGKVYDGKGVICDGLWWGRPTDEQFRKAGLTWEDPPPVIPPPPAPKRYSKLKVIRALGEGWAAKKAMIEQAGLWDQFVAAAFLAEDDPAFAAVLATLTPEERELLDAECLYDE